MKRKPNNSWMSHFMQKVQECPFYDSHTLVNARIKNKIRNWRRILSKSSELTKMLDRALASFSVQLF